METIIYTADDEEPVCTRCFHFDGDDYICVERCGAEHAWFGYERVENVKD